MTKPAELFDVYPIIPPSFWHTPTALLLILLGILILLGLAYMAYRWFFTEKTDDLPPYEHALKIFDGLEKELPENKVQGKRFYFTLTTTLKNYFSEQFGWHMEDKTDIEFFFALSQIQKHDPSLFDRKVCTLLSELLDGVTEVKFADARTIKAKVVQDLKRARQILEDTRPEPTSSDTT